MTEKQSASGGAPDHEELAQKWAALAERSQRLVETFAQRQGTDHGFTIADPQSIASAFAELGTRMMADPGKMLS